MNATIIKNYYSTNGGINNKICYNVFKGHCLIQSFRGKTAGKRAKKLVSTLNK